MANLAELTTYKAKLMEAICTSDVIVSLLKLDGESEMSGRDLMYARVFPYAYVPDTTERAKTFICYTINVPSVFSNTIKSIEIDFYVFAHQSLMRLPNSAGLRVDRIVMGIDKMLNGSYEYGLGGVELQSLYPINPITGYHGNVLKYRVKDINRNICGG